MKIKLNFIWEAASVEAWTEKRHGSIDVCRWDASQFLLLLYFESVTCARRKMGEQSQSFSCSHKIQFAKVGKVNNNTAKLTFICFTWLVQQSFGHVNLSPIMFRNSELLHNVELLRLEFCIVWCCCCCCVSIWIIKYSASNGGGMAKIPI